MSLSRTIERALYPYALFLQTVPIVAIAPLLVLWFGPGLRAVSVSAFIVSVFPVVTNTLAGLRGVDPRLRDLFRLYGAGRRDTLFKLKLPFALSSIAHRLPGGIRALGHRRHRRRVRGWFLRGEGGARYRPCWRPIDSCEPISSLPR